MSYSDLERCVRQFAGYFSDRLAPRVLVALPSGAEAYAAMLGTGLAGS